MATITGDGVAQEIQVRILDFLNSVSTAADIAGTEPQSGPIHDDPSTGYGDQGLCTCDLTLSRCMKREQQHTYNPQVVGSIPTL